MVEQKGLILVYTGDGKGKTTAALGVGLRAVGHGMKVFMLQFMKGQGETGELASVKQLEGFEIEQAGRPNFIMDAPDAMDIEAAAAGLQRAQEIIASQAYHMVILDEVNMAVKFGLLSEGDVLDLMKHKPSQLHLILTGRGATQAIMAKADLVSEVREIKHPYNEGIQAQKGLEF